MVRLFRIIHKSKNRLELDFGSGVIQTQNLKNIEFGSGVIQIHNLQNIEFGSGVIQTPILTYFLCFIPNCLTIKNILLTFYSDNFLLGTFVA